MHFPATSEIRDMQQGSVIQLQDFDEMLMSQIGFHRSSRLTSAFTPCVQGVNDGSVSRLVITPVVSFL